MVRTYKFFIMLLISGSIIAMDNKDEGNVDLKHIKQTSSKSDKNELAKWYEESFITKENFAKVLRENLSFPAELSDIVYDYVWLFNIMPINSQKFNFNVSAFSKDGKYLAMDNISSEDGKQLKVLDYSNADMRKHSIIIKKLNGDRYEDLASNLVCSSKDPYERITHMSFSPNGKYLVSIYGNHEFNKNYELKVWSIEDRDLKLQNKYFSDKRIENNVQFDYDQSTIIFMLRDRLKIINLIDNTTKDLNFNFEEFEYILSNFRILPEEKILIQGRSSEENRYKLQIFDVVKKTKYNLDVDGLGYDIHPFVCSNIEILIPIAKFNNDKHPYTTDLFLIKFNFITHESKRINLGNFSDVIHNFTIAFNKKILLIQMSKRIDEKWINELKPFSLDDLNPLLPFDFIIEAPIYIFLTDDGKLISKTFDGDSVTEKTITIYETSDSKHNE